MGYIKNDSQPWYDHWKTGGYGESDYREEVCCCDICGCLVPEEKTVTLCGTVWCEDCYNADEDDSSFLDEDLEEFEDEVCCR